MEKTPTRITNMLDRASIVELLNDAERNLEGWQEPDASGAGGGTLVLTEPDVEQRALVRIRLRAHVDTLRRVLGMPLDVDASERRDHRDMQRIRDAALAEQGDE